MSNVAKHILLVDDERPILRSLQRSFAETDYEIHIASGGAEALQLLEGQPVDLIISDMRMPEMDGHQFLQRVKALYPDTLRIILSGYSDETGIFRSLLDGSAKLYLLKPWENDRLLQVVGNMLRTRDLFHDKRILDAVSGMDGLPVVAKTYAAVNRLVNENADMKDIAVEIEKDAALATRVLSLANSAFNGVNTGSVKQAIIYMGLAVVKELLLATSVVEAAPLRGPGFDRSLFWRHASHSNQIVEKIYRKKLGKKLPDVVACAGLLHDVGTVFMVRHFAAFYAQVVQRLTADKNLIASEVEKDIIGISHEELGGYLLDWWGLPFPMVEAAMFHHAPLAATDVNRDIVCAVHVASWLSWKILGKSSGRDVEPWALKQLNLSPEECQELARQLT